VNRAVFGDEQAPAPSLGVVGVDRIEAGQQLRTEE